MLPAILSPRFPHSCLCTKFYFFCLPAISDCTCSSFTAAGAWAYGIFYQVTFFIDTTRKYLDEYTQQILCFGFFFFQKIKANEMTDFYLFINKKRKWEQKKNHTTLKGSCFFCFIQLSFVFYCRSFFLLFIENHYFSQIFIFFQIKSIIIASFYFYIE